LDTFTRGKRSEIMRRVKSIDTKPELLVRSLLHRLGFRFRIHSKDLPGKPDIVLAKYKTIIFVHGCFWHQHSRCKEADLPASRRDYWVSKFEKNIKRDRINSRRLRLLGWKVVLVWECETKNSIKLAERLVKDIIGGSVGYDSSYAIGVLAAEKKGEYRRGLKGS